MANRKILPILYAVSIASIAPAMLAKYLHSNTLMVWFTICVAAQFLFAFAAIAELKNLTHVSEERKGRWSSLLLVAPIIFGALYLINIREKSFNQV